jgi:hypothetical protein
MNTWVSFKKTAITPMLSNLSADIGRREIQLAQVFEAFVIASLVGECGVVKPSGYSELTDSLWDWVFQLESSPAHSPDITEALYVSHTEMTHEISLWFPSLPKILEGTLRRYDFWKLAALGLSTSDGALHNFGISLILHYRSLVQYDSSRQFQFFLRFSDDDEWSRILSASVSFSPTLSGDSDLASLLDGFLRLLAYFNDVNQTLKACTQLGLERSNQTRLKERLLDVHQWRLQLTRPKTAKRVEEVKARALENLFSDSTIAPWLERSKFEGQIEDILQEWFSSSMAHR